MFAPAVVENWVVAVATNTAALCFESMKYILRNLRQRMRGMSSRTLADEQRAIPVVTVSPYRGNLALKHDRSQHRRYTAHFEDLQN
jgi:hypothetical protein